MSFACEEETYAHPPDKSPLCIVVGESMVDNVRSGEKEDVSERGKERDGNIT
jgi:hypothetical protein